MSARPCHLCLLDQGSPYCFLGVKKRTANQTISLLNTFDGGRDLIEMEKSFGGLSMHPALPLFVNFPFDGIVSCVDLWEIVIVMSMHTLSLGICKILKDFVVGLLGDSE